LESVHHESLKKAISSCQLTASEYSTIQCAQCIV